MENLTPIMKKAWIIPACFLLVAALVNFVARYIGAAPVAAMVKPALLPLVALTTVAAVGGMEDKYIRRLVTAQLLGAAGDIFLIADGTIPFGLGLGCFLAGHIFFRCGVSADSHSSCNCRYGPCGCRPAYWNRR